MRTGTIAAEISEVQEPQLDILYYHKTSLKTPNMTTGIILTVLGVIGYLTNVLLIQHYLNKRTPGILDMDEKLADDSYAWEHTSGTGTVPKWVSLIGLFGMGCLVIGIIIIIVSFFM